MEVAATLQALAKFGLRVGTLNMDVHITKIAYGNLAAHTRIYKLQKGENLVILNVWGIHCVI
jgi:hypothetical protein